MVYEKFEIDDAVPAICEKFAKGQYRFEDLEDNHVFDHEILKILEDTCQNDEMMFEITKGLLETRESILKAQGEPVYLMNLKIFSKNHSLKTKQMQLIMRKRKKELRSLLKNNSH